MAEAQSDSKLSAGVDIFSASEVPYSFISLLHNPQLRWKLLAWVLPVRFWVANATP
jgi:hypothetical protein